MVTRATALTSLDLKTVIVRDPLVVAPETIVTDAIAQMNDARSRCNGTKTADGQSNDLLAARSSCVIVVEANQVVGILTEQDVVRLIAQQQPLDLLAMRQVMTPAVVTLHESACTDLFFVVNLLQHYHICHLPILDQQDRLVGLVTYESLHQTARSLNLLRCRVAEVMIHNVICAAPDRSMLTIAQLMSNHCVSSILIVELGGNSTQPLQVPVGILTAEDLVQFQALGLNLESCSAAVIKRPICEVTPEEPLSRVQQIMEQPFVRHVAVTGQQGELMGIVTQPSLLQALNPLKLYEMAEDLAEKVVRLEAENVALLKSHTLELEHQVDVRTADLKTKAEQEKLLAELATQIRSSLSRQTILNTTVEQVWKVLGCDRVNIWQFEANGQITAVAESTDSALSLIGEQVSGLCFKQDRAEIYRQGHIRIVPDIYTTELLDSHREMLIRLQTRAEILVPLFCGEELWGFLKATEKCVRHWQSEEVKLLEALLVHLTIALQQATIHQPLQEELAERQRAEAFSQHQLAELTKWQTRSELAGQASGQMFYEYDDQGETMGEIGIVTDSSDRTQAEFALKQSEGTSKAVLAAIPDLMFRVGADGVYRGYITPHRGVDVFLQDVDPTGRSLTDMLPAELADRQLHYLQKALQTDELQVYEQQVQVGDRLQDEEVRVVKSGDDEVLFMIRDISDRKQAEAVLQCLIESTASVTGKDFFSTLAQQLMLALKVQYVLATKLVGDHLQTLAYWKDGEPQPEMTVALTDAPCCASAVTQGRFYCPKGLQQRFSEYPIIQSLQAESYLGIPITSTNGQRLGNLCILDNKPIENIQWAEAFLRIFALRAAAELERQQATEDLEQLNQELEARVEQRTSALRDSEATLSAIFNQAAVGMNLATLDGQYVKVNQKLCDILGYTQEELLTMSFRDVFHPDVEDGARSQRQQLYDGAIDSFCIERLYLHKDGSAVWVTVAVSLIYKPSGEPAYSIGVVKEIGDRKRAEEALRQSEEKFRQLAEHIQSVFWISSADRSETIYVSPAYETIWGRSCDSLYASPQSFADAIHPKDWAQILALLTKQTERYDEEYRILQPNGALRWIRDRAFPIYNAQGEVYRLAGIAEDITDRKQSEETLNRQLALIEASIDGIVMLNTHGECTYLNEAYVKLFGYGCAEELLGKPWQMLCSSGEMSRFEQDIFPKLVKARAWRGEAIATRRDGSTFANEVSFTLTPTGEMVCVCRDISDRRQAEQALQQSEEQFRTVFDYAPIAISLARVDNYQILRVNAAHRQLIGYTNAELATMSFIDFSHPDDIDDDIKQVKQMVRGEIPGFHMEKRFVKKNGDVILTNMTVALIRDRNGSPLYCMAMIEDITERRQEELEIIRNRDLREAIFNESTDAIFLVNVEPSLTIDCNRRAVELFEASAKDDLLQIEGHTLQRHQFTKEELKFINQEMTDKGFWSCEVEYITRKGNSFWGNLAAKQVSIAGRVMNLVRVTDISERKQSDLLLKAQQDFLRRLIDTVPNLIFVKDWEGRFTLVNQATANVYKSTIADLISKTDADFNPNLEEVEQFLAADREVMTTRATKVLEEMVTSPDGKQFYCQTIKTPIMSVDGHSREILGVATDISDRRQIEEQLRRSEAYLLEAQRIAHVGSWEFDIATQKTTWSAETFRIFGRDPAQQEPTYEELKQYIHPDDRNHHKAVLQQTIEQKQTFELEQRVLRPDGAISYVLAKGQPILDETGRLLSFLGTVLDITNRKQFEEQLRQTNEQLARTTRLKDEFLANMSHELRTPLNAILGMTEGLQDHVFGMINDRQLKALQTIERSGSHLLELINDILDIAKIESGQLELDCIPTAVMSLCQSSLTFVRQQALKKRIQLEIKLPPNLPDLSVDGRRIRQVLINLVNNAVKFTPDGGRITLQVSRYQSPTALESAESPPQTFLRIAVIDTGIGIAPEHINKLFQPFIQIDSALNRQYQGTGLGLALVKRIVELHGGQVGLTSEVGVGSCFTIDLPCDALPFSTELETQLTPIPDSSSPEKASPLILLAEDNEANIMTLSGYLKAKGYQVLLAKSGQEAVALAQSKTPDLILMDIQMPGMDGLEAMQQIRREPTLSNVPIIALTALAMAGDRERCLAAGSTDYLSKPIPLRQLVTTIQQLLNLS